MQTLHAAFGLSLEEVLRATLGAWLTGKASFAHYRTRFLIFISWAGLGFANDCERAHSKTNPFLVPQTNLTTRDSAPRRPEVIVHITIMKCTLCWTVSGGKIEKNKCVE